MKPFIMRAEKLSYVKYDIVVLGGGPAGWVAAVSAARNGCKVAVIERYGFFGGTATAGIVVPLSGLFFHGEQVIEGIPWEFSQEMIRLGGAKLELPKGHLSFDPETYKLCAQRYVTAAGADTYMNSLLTDCLSSDGGRLDAVSVHNKSGQQLIYADCFIDATGDADAFHMMGLPMLPQTCPLQPVSLCFVLDGVDTDTGLLRDFIHHDGIARKNSCQTDIQRLFTRLYNEGKAPLFGGPWFNALVTGPHIAVNITRAVTDATDSRALSKVEFGLREDMFALTDLLRRNYPEFRNAYISSSGIQAGVRETRHIKARHILTGEELLSGRTTDETIAYAAHPMDIHLGDGSGQILKSLECPGPVPFGCMISGDSPNLIAAGRCVGADRDAYATIRVQATVMAMGEAAGTAAAMSVRNGGDIRRLDTAELQKRLNFRRIE